MSKEDRLKAITAAFKACNLRDYQNPSYLCDIYAEAIKLLCKLENGVEVLHFEIEYLEASARKAGLNV